MKKNNFHYFILQQYSTCLRYFMMLMCLWYLLYSKDVHFFINLFQNEFIGHYNMSQSYFPWLTHIQVYLIKIIFWLENMSVNVSLGVITPFSHRTIPQIHLKYLLLLLTEKMGRIENIWLHEKSSFFLSKDSEI